MLLQLMLDEGNGQAGAVYRYIHLLEDIGKGADVVLMSMGDHKALYLVNVLLQIGHVRDYQVDAQHIISREGKAAVYDNNAVVKFKGGNVHTDLLQSA